MRKDKLDLEELVKTAGSTRMAPTPAPSQQPEPRPAAAHQEKAPSRRNTVPITYHAPLAVRTLLKQIATEKEIKLQRKVTIEECIGEAFNDFFAKYGKAEIAPVKGFHLPASDNNSGD